MRNTSSLLKKLVDWNLVHLEVLGAVFLLDIYFHIKGVSVLFMTDWTDVRLAFLDMLIYLSFVLHVQVAYDSLGCTCWKLSSHIYRIQMFLREISVRHEIHDFRLNLAGRS